uniref:Uncharacterized protein n=2 Tax=Panagrolaimus superbus TaxID=310955 RepID=A0A914YHA3_9BILA
MNSCKDEGRLYAEQIDNFGIPDGELLNMTASNPNIATHIDATEKRNLTAYQCVHKENGQQCQTFFQPACRNHRIKAYVEYYNLSQQRNPSSSSRRIRSPARSQRMMTIDVANLSKVCFHHSIPIAHHNLNAPIQHYYRSEFDKKHMITFDGSDASSLTNPADRTFQMNRRD